MLSTVMSNILNYSINANSIIVHSQAGFLKNLHIHTELRLGKMYIITIF